jgi:hypothetical protein
VTDFNSTTDALEVLVAPFDDQGDWEGILAQALAVDAAERRTRRPLWRRPRVVPVVGVCALVAAGLATVALATPLGSAIAHGIGGFSAWISGEPGSPAPKGAQQAFDKANARSWLGFPSGTQLRLLSTKADAAAGTKVQLLGFRSGSTLCVRVRVLGTTRGSGQGCAPLASLQQAGSPVRVLLVDQGFGKGKTYAWYGIQRFGSRMLQVTAGIVADGVKSVTLTDQSGTHTVPVRANAFLYVAWTPEVGQSISRITATTASGVRSVPFTPAAFGFFPGFGPSSSQPTGPSSVQRRVTGGTISWLDNQKPVGQPLSVLPKQTARLIRNNAVFGRVIAPDPGAPIRVAVTTSTSRPGGKATGLCTWLISNGGGSAGGCAVRADIFSRGPVSWGTTSGGSGSDQFSIASGLASDDVAKIVAYLANGQTQAVPLADNVYAVQLASADYPVRLVSYDSAGRIIGVDPILRGLGDRARPAPGKAKELLHVTGATGESATLYIGKATDGGTCMYVRSYLNKHVGGDEVGCMGPAWRGSTIQLGGGGASGIWNGRVRPDVATVELRFADGHTTTIKPIQGFILYAEPKTQTELGHGMIEAIARDASGKEVGDEKLTAPKH